MNVLALAPAAAPVRPAPREAFLVVTSYYGDKEVQLTEYEEAAARRERKDLVRDYGFEGGDVKIYAFYGAEAARAADAAEDVIRENSSKPFGRKALARLAAEFSLDRATLL